jgi:hypothetical protein
MIRNAIEKNKVRAVLDSCFPLEEVQQVFDRSASQRAKGKICVLMTSEAADEQKKRDAELKAAAEEKAKANKEKSKQTEEGKNKSTDTPASTTTTSSVTTSSNSQQPTTDSKS